MYAAIQHKAQQGELQPALW